MSRDNLARRQAELAAAVAVGAAVPAGFDEAAVRAAGRALLGKRASEVAAAWPVLRSQYGPQWMEEFTAFAAGRPGHGALRDGWDLARTVAERGELGPAAAAELSEREARWRYDGVSPPRRRRFRFRLGFS